MLFAEKAIKFYLNLPESKTLPGGVSILSPYKSDAVKYIIKSFYKKYYNDDNNRIFIWGINPGRFGGGLTGIAFTDPVALREHCGIANDLGSQKELSSKYIYEMISAYGGAEKFFSECFLSALYPLALIKDDKNYNFYDEPGLYEALKNEITSSFIQQINFGAKQNLAVCLGKKNYKYLKEINDEINYFENIEILEHPRYIMQYKTKSKDAYIKKYIDLLKNK